jgi:hypothetical protein
MTLQLDREYHWKKWSLLIIRSVQLFAWRNFERHEVAQNSHSHVRVEAWTSEIESGISNYNTPLFMICRCLDSNWGGNKNNALKTKKFVMLLTSYVGHSQFSRVYLICYILCEFTVHLSSDYIILIFFYCVQSTSLIS